MGKNSSEALRLSDGARVAVIGGGPAGSFFAYFFLETASRVGLSAGVDIYEPKNLELTGPAACNMCGGIISESLVQVLATEGINLPSEVVQRGIDSYVMHMDVGSVRIEPPGQEKRIAAVHRGGGPRGVVAQRWTGFDGHLLRLAVAEGATVIRERVEGIDWENGKPRLTTKGGQSVPYDLLVGAVGVNGPGIKLFEGLKNGYVPPKTAKTFICELHLGAAVIAEHFGNAMHVFLLNLPRLEFAALIPKGEYVTVVMLGADIDKQLVADFLNSPEVRRCFPEGWGVPPDYCRCFPSINVLGSPQPFADRMVFIGDCGESRLYKDGLGGAYRAAKAAAKAAVFEGVSAEAFRRQYLPTCRALAVDNAIGKVIFMVTKLIQALRFTRRGILGLVYREQQRPGSRQRMSDVLWDTFTGSAPYRDIFYRTLHPMFLIGLVYDIVKGFFSRATPPLSVSGSAALADLGKVYRDGEPIVRQGELGHCMYVIQSGRVEVLWETEGKETRLAELADGDFFGEMALIEQSVRSATVRALGEVRVLTVDKRMFLRKIHEDSSLAFRVLEKMSGRIRELDGELARMRQVGQTVPSAPDR